MKILTIFLLLTIAVISGFQGYIYTGFENCKRVTGENFESKEYESGINSINNLRNQWWYKVLVKYPRVDFLEIDKQLDYQKAQLLTRLGELSEANNLFERSAQAKDDVLAARSLYNQGNLALYNGNARAAIQKWEESLKKEKGGHDFDAQVNLELMKQEQKKSNASAAAMAAKQTHRRNYMPLIPLRKFGQKDKTIRP